MKNKVDRIFGIIIIMVIIFGGARMYSESKTNEMLDKECEDRGFLKFTSKGGFDFCEFKNGNLLYVKYECVYRINFLELFPKDCTMQKIKIGESYLG